MDDNRRMKRGRELPRTSAPRRTRWLPRGTTPIPRSGRPKKRNPQKHAANWLRAHGSIERVEWIKGLPSVASGKRPCVNAHVRTGGTSRKADACWIVPLTDAEHRHELHQHGAPWFEQKYGIDLDACARATAAAWLALTQTGDAA